jgi:hypothetical protein
MTAVRRFAVLCALLFWQGGFTFYGTIVIPVGARVLGSHREQAVITRQVSLWLNVAGAGAIALMLWDSLATPDPVSRRRRTRLLLVAFQIVALGALVWLHQALDEQFDPAARTIHDRSWFQAGHRWYLHISAAQWGASLVWLLLSLVSWKASDRKEAAR